MLDTSTFEGLREYYYIGALVTWNTHREFEDHIGDKVIEVIDAFDESCEERKKRDLEYLHYLKAQLSTRHSYAMLPMFLGLLERVVKGISKISDEVAYGQVDQRRWFRTHVTFLESKGVDFSSVQEEIEKVNDLSRLRHCVVHANGEIDLCKDPAVVRGAISRIETAGEFKDGFVSLGDQVIPTAHLANSEILGLLFTYFGYPLDCRRWH